MGSPALLVGGSRARTRRRGRLPAKQLHALVVGVVVEVPGLEVLILVGPGRRDARLTTDGSADVGDLRRVEVEQERGQARRSAGLRGRRAARRAALVGRGAVGDP